MTVRVGSAWLLLPTDRPSLAMALATTIVFHYVASYERVGWPLSQR